MSYLPGCLAPASPHRVVVVGGGFSGTTLAVQLLLRSTIPLHITIIDRSMLPNRGVAYTSSRPEHLLNVKASHMSALTDDPEHFARWLAASGLGFSPEDFVPRHIYGHYLAALFNQVRESCTHCSVSWITGTALSLELRDEVAKVRLGDGQTIDGNVVVLAMGNAPPALPRPLVHIEEAFVARYAWMDSALSGIPEFGTVLVLGCGLTAVDQVLALRAQNFQGKIVLLSRRGMLPAIHSGASDSWSPDWATGLQGLRSITACLREQIKLAQTHGKDWRLVIDGLRTVSPILWQSLSLKDRKRFLRHLRSYWEVSRHRMPPQTFAVLEGLGRCGRLWVVAGTLLSAEQHADHVAISYRERGTDIATVLPVHRIINCIGPGFIPRSQDPLIEQMVKDHLARPDPVGLGIETAFDGAVLSSSGASLDGVYTIGPVRKASLWETTAVREIRLQAIELADRILEKSRLRLPSIGAAATEELESHS